MAERVRIVEVGPRDGLQNEVRPVATPDKIRLIDLLSAAGFDYVEAASFVSPKRVPQMADGAEVMAGIARRPGTVYAALVPNETGYARARAAGADEVAVFASASEGFSLRNLGCSIDESFERFRPVMAAAAADGIPVRGYVSCVVACPYDGQVAPASVAAVAARLLAIGCREVSLGETLGVAAPDDTARMLDAVLEAVPAGRLAGHFHDTSGRALLSVDVALDRGLRVFDASVAGLGGCPFAPGARGNVATRAVVERLEARGFATGIDLAALAEAERFVRGVLSAG
jgi:hydroxymethylglutaryl-CoA lyase